MAETSNPSTSLLSLPKTQSFESAVGSNAYLPLINVGCKVLLMLSVSPNAYPALCACVVVQCGVR